jgi:hypothetical protein
MYGRCTGPSTTRPSTAASRSKKRTAARKREAPVPELLKNMVFRVPVKLKTDFKVSLLKNGVNVIQNAFEAFMEAVVEFDRGEKTEAMRIIFKRAKTLSDKGA